MQVLAGFQGSRQWQKLLAQCSLVQRDKASSEPQPQCLTSLLDVDQLADLLNQHTSLQLLLCYDAPEHVIASKLEQGDTPEQAVSYWQAQITPLLALQQQQRRRLQLVQTDAVLNQSAELPLWLQAALPSVPQYALPGSAMLLVAAQILRQQQEANRLSQRLLACSLPQQHAGLMLDLALAQQQLSDKSVVTALQTQLDASNDERDLLLQQLLHVQEELEQYYLQCQQLQGNSAQIAQLEKQWQGRLNGKIKLIAAKDEKLHSLSTKLKALRLQLAQCQHEVDSGHKLQKQSERNQARLEQQLALLQQELTAVKGSVLWKSAEPVRKLARVLGKGEHERQQLQQETALILTSEYFDPTWYVQTYPDVAQASMDPAEHYLRFGAAEGRCPGPLFDGKSYLQRYQDVALAGLNPLLHFIKFGRAEGRTATPISLASKQAPAKNATVINSQTTTANSKNTAGNSQVKGS